MPDAPQAATKKAPRTPAKAGPKAAKGKPDLATLSGIVIALGGIIGGLILEKGSIQDVAQGTAAMIVFGGTLGAVLVTTPLPVFRRALHRLGSVLFEQVNSTTSTIEALIQYAPRPARTASSAWKRRPRPYPMHSCARPSAWQWTARIFRRFAR